MPPTDDSRGHGLRSVSLLVLLFAVGASGAVALRRVVVGSAEVLTGTAPPDDQVAAMLVLLSAAGAALTWAWLLLCVLACLDDLRGPSGARWRLGALAALEPQGVRRIVCRLVGAAAVPAILAPAVAGPGALVSTAGPAVAVAHEQPRFPRSLSGLPLPDRVTGTSERRETYRVRAGDTLWGISAAQLPPGSPDAAVDRSWRRLFAFNRAAVGSDPHLIRPGTLLRLPGRPGPLS